MAESNSNTENVQEPAEQDASDAEDNLQSDEENAEINLEALQHQLAEQQDKLVRMQAEMDNQRKRAARQVEDAHKFSIEKFSRELLQVKDSLELGLNAENIDVDKLQEGTELTLRMLNNVLGKFEIEEVNPAGEPFDPNLHEAMTTQESAEHEPNTVVTVVQKGYTLHQRLLRPAMVIVAKAPANNE